MSVDVENLKQLIHKWKHRAKKQLDSSEYEITEEAKCVLTHGAACYANAALELEKLLEDKC